MFSSFPFKSQVFSLPQYGQMRPCCTVGYSCLQPSHQVIAGRISTFIAQPVSIGFFLMAHSQQSVR